MLLSLKAFVSLWPKKDKKKNLILLWRAKTLYISSVPWTHDICSIPKIEHIGKYWPNTHFPPPTNHIATNIRWFVSVWPKSHVHIKCLLSKWNRKPFCGGDFYDSMAMGIVDLSENHIFYAIAFCFILFSLSFSLSVSQTAQNFWCQQ